MEAAQVPWRPLGELFVSRGLIKQAELETALAEQAATGKRLGEILVDRGLVSGPDLTSALMDQLGIEISKEEGFGSGLWAEIKRRHRRALPDGSEDAEPEAGAERGPGISLVPPFEPEPGYEYEYEPEPAREPEPDPIVPLPAAVHLELEQELAKIRAEYQSPAPVESPAIVVRDPEPEAGREPRSEPDDTVALRAELEGARADLKLLQEMLADAMTALAALTAEPAGRPYDH